MWLRAAKPYPPLLVEKGTKEQTIERLGPIDRRGRIVAKSSGCDFTPTCHLQSALLQDAWTSLRLHDWQAADSAETCLLRRKITSIQTVYWWLSSLQISLHRGQATVNASNPRGHLAAKDSPETLAKEQNISCNVSGPVKAICFSLPWVRGQRAECTHTAQHIWLERRCFASSYSTCAPSPSSASPVYLSW